MKELKMKFQDNEEGEELQDISPENDENNSNKETTIGIYNPAEYKKMKDLKNKKSSKKCIKILVSLIIIILVSLALILIYKYFFKKPPKPLVPKFNEAQFFIDGKNYFEDLFNKLMLANDTIYITDWWLSPEVFLRRPVNITPYLSMKENNLIENTDLENMTRLMDVLNYKAKQGVKIYILIYKEFSFAMNLNSEHTESILNSLNENIKVTRYPSFTDTIYWSDHEKLVIIDNIIGYVGGLDLCWGRYDNNQHPINEAINKDNIYEFPFIDYSNIRIKDFSNVDNYYIESVPREEAPRLPWHDVHTRIIGLAVENITKHFIQRWNYANPKENHIKFIVDKNITNITNITNKTEILKKYFDENIPPADIQTFRSVSEWNTGVTQTEDSILNAYYKLIENSKHYIYIENQFFVSRSWNEEERKNNKNCINDKVENKIAYYIRKRIEKAYENKENFKVYIFIPLLPGFDGVPYNSEIIKIILKHTYASINRNFGLSLIEQLEKIMGGEWKNYLRFFSLRNHGLVNNIPKTEIIYIHSKLMIIDDKTVLIGSANINDRSMLGDRDSEFAVIINEKEEIENIKTGKKYIMDGKSNYNATNFAVELRKKLMAEHLGINPDEPILDDPVSDKLFKFCINRAKNNTKIYHYLFTCYPHDSFINFKILKNTEEIKKYQNMEDLVDEYDEYKTKIIGHIVEFPLLFLKDENLKTSWMSKEIVLPEINFTL